MLPASCVFYGYDDPACTTSVELTGPEAVSAALPAARAIGLPVPIASPKQISKVKIVDVHAVQPWLLAADLVSLLNK